MTRRTDNGCLGLSMAIDARFHRMLHFEGQPVALVHRPVTSRAFHLRDEMFGVAENHEVRQFVNAAAWNGAVLDFHRRMTRPARSG